jgi:hypothetical protein
MNIPHVHLILTHAPIFMVIIGVAVLIAALLRRSVDLRWAAYALFVLGALVAIPVFLSGEGSEEAIEHIAGVSEAVIDAHAAAAKISLIGIEILGLASLVAFALERMRRELIAPVMGLLVVLGTHECVTGIHGEPRRTDSSFRDPKWGSRRQWRVCWRWFGA